MQYNGRTAKELGDRLVNYKITLELALQVVALKENPATREALDQLKNIAKENEIDLEEKLELVMEGLSNVQGSVRQTLENDRKLLEASIAACKAAQATADSHPVIDLRLDNNMADNSCQLIGGDKLNVNGKVSASDNRAQNHDIVIALMGVTGSGKSTFIKRVTGREDIQIGHQLTSSLSLYNDNASRRDVKLTSQSDTLELDTPGFNDTSLDDAAILAELATFMEFTYRADVKLTAIIYLHPITNDRLEGSALGNLSMFQKLCGPNFYPNIVLATNFWSLIDETTGRRRERRLVENGDWWGRMKDHGSQIVRLPDDREECVTLLMKLSGNQKVALQIQEELVDQEQPISRTRAGSIAKNSQALEELREEWNQQVAALAAEREAALQKQRAEMQRLQAEKRMVLENEIRRIQEELAAAKQNQEASIREIEEKHRNGLEEQERSNRETMLQNEMMNEELAQLEIKDAQETRQGQLSERRLSRDLAVQKLTAKMKNQINLFEEAKATRTVKCKFSTAWDQTLLGHYCDKCLHPCSAQVSYSQFSG
ncbi:hypothetical protein KCU98_g1485, partial [Aureobasidium melanogenum]